MYRRFLAVVFGIVLAVIFTACDIPPDATTAPTDVPITSIPPSVTVAPIMPTAYNPESGNVDAQSFTPRAPDVSDATLGITVTPTPGPTEANIPVQFPIGDGLVIAGTYYGAPSRPAPTVLLLHMEGSTKEVWRLFAAQLQIAGYNVLTIDLRGYGDTGGTVDWGKAIQDIPSVLDRVRTFPGVDAGRISVVGAGMGANVALAACATYSGCSNLALISPTLNTQGLQTGDAMTQYGRRPVLIVASKSDKPSNADSGTLDKLAQGDHKLQLYDGPGYGTVLLSTHTDLSGLIIQWLKAAHS